MKASNHSLWLTLSLFTQAGAVLNATLAQRQNASTPHLSNATRLRLAAIHLQNVTLAGLETAAKGVQQGLHSSYAWAAQASAPIIEDVQPVVVAAQPIRLSNPTARSPGGVV